MQEPLFPKPKNTFLGLGSLFDYPPFNWNSIPRALKAITTPGDEKDWQWYDQQGNLLQSDTPYGVNPEEHMQIFDAVGRRYVMWRGKWTLDDPGAGRAYAHPLAQAFRAFYMMIPIGRVEYQGAMRTVFAASPNKATLGMQALEYVIGHGREGHGPPTYMNFDGTYRGGVDGSKTYEKGSLAWIMERYGQNMPPNVLAALIEKYGVPLEQLTPEQEFLVKHEVDKQIYGEPRWMTIDDVQKLEERKPGDVFTDEFGRQAVQGWEPNQYAVTIDGEGDRYKSHIERLEKDGQEYWVKVYTRSLSAHKLKQQREENKPSRREKIRQAKREG